MLRRGLSILWGRIKLGLTRKVALSLGVLTLTLGAGLERCSALEGVENVTVTIGGKNYRVPMANKEYQSDFYLFRKALSGDKDAFEIILGDKEEKLFYIGDYEPLWAKITRYNIEVMEKSDG